MRLVITNLVFLLALTAVPAQAYIGPGAGISAIGTFLAVVGSVVLLIVGFLWYPVKRLIKGKKKPVEDPNTPANPQ